MAKGSILAEISLSGDRTFRRAVESSGEKMDDAARNAGTLSGALSYAGNALEETSRNALGLTGSLFGLQSAAGEAEDEIDSVGRSARSSSGWFSTLAFSTDGAALSFGTLSAVTAGTLIPALATLGTILVPIAAALGGLGFVLGSIAGIGAVGLFGAIATRGKELKTAFDALVSTAKQELAPIFNIAAEVLFSLMGALSGVLDEIVPTDAVLSRLAGNFAQFGHTLIGLLPEFTSLATTLALEFLPPLVTLAQDLLPKLPGLIRRFVGVMRQLVPMARSVSTELAELAPTALKFGMNVISIVAPALVDMLDILGQAMTAVNGMDAGLQELVIAGTLLAPVLTSIGGTLLGLSAPILAVVGAVGVLAAAWQQDVGNIRDIVANVGTRIQRILGERIPEIIESAAEAWTAWKPILTPIFNFVTAALGLIVTQGLDSILTTLDIVLDVLSGDFGEAWKTFVGLAERSISRVAEFINRFSSGALEDLLNTLIEVYNTVGKVAEKTDVFGEEFTFNPMDEVDIGTTPFSPGSDSKQRRPPGTSGARTGGGRERVDVNVDVGVNDDGEIQTYVDKRIESKDSMKAKEARFQ